MAVTVTATPVTGGGFGNRKVVRFELTGTYETGGFALDFDPTGATFLVNGVCTVWDSSTKKLKLGTIVTDTASVFTELMASTNLATQNITAGVAIF